MATYIGETRRSYTGTCRAVCRNASAGTSNIVSYGRSNAVQVAQPTPTPVGRNRRASSTSVSMASEEEIRCQHIRELILANKPDNEYEFEISTSSYDQLKVEFGKDDEDGLYPRLFYDWTRQVVTIVTVPTRLHEDTSRAILNQLCNRVESVMQSEGIHLAPGQRLGSSNSPTTVIISGDSNYEMQPDGVIFFTTPAGEDYKVVVEVGVSQAYESLLEKARKWILDSECKIVLLLAFYEKERYAAPRKRITLTSQQVNDQVVQMRRRWPSTNVSEFSGLVFKGHTWLNEISEGFIDVIRKDRESDDTDALTNFKYILIDMGRDERSSVPASVGDIRLAELIPRESLGSAAGDIVVDFFNSDAFMDEVRTALISTAVTRFKKSVKLIV